MKWLNSEFLYQEILAKWNVIKDDGRKDPLIRTLMKTYMKTFVYAFIINFFQVLLEISVPFMIWAIIDFMAEKGENKKPIGYGIFLIVLYLVIDLVAKILSQQGNFVQGLLGARAYTGVVSIIYNKVLKCSSATNKAFTQGEIINFIQVDASKILYLAWVFPTVARLPIQLVFAITYLLFFFGYSLLGAFGVSFVLIIINFMLAIIGQKIQKRVLARKDTRMRFTTELINNIKIIKLNSWIKYFNDKLTNARNSEVGSIRCTFYFMALNIFIIFALGPMLILSTYGIFFATGHTISLGQGMAALQVLNSLNTPIRWIPSFIGTLLQFSVSMRRIEKFLLCDEVNPAIVEINSMEAQNKDYDIIVENANFSWGGKKDDEIKAKPSKKAEPKKETKETKPKSKNKGINEYENLSDSDDSEETKLSTSSDSTTDEARNMKVTDSVQISDLDLQIHKGEFICIIGPVGSGKSSLISALLGDMIYMSDGIIEEYANNYMDDKIRHKIVEASAQFSSQVKLGGSISYVQQVPWIQNKTIRDNILFDLPMNEDKYNKTIELCELGSDLDMLPGGDLTEIGEKGINLSGGQKARISLARAVYADADIILMDDPISALDSNVKQRIFDNLFLDELRYKTRILVTHAVEFLPKVDRIIIMDHGRVKYIATYEELQNSSEIQQIVETLSQIQVGKEEEKEGDDKESKDKSQDEKKSEEKVTKTRRSFISEKGQNITEDENEEQITVNWYIYYRFFLSQCTWVFLIILIPMSIAASYMNVRNGIEMGNWITDSENDDKYWKYFFTIAGLSLGYALLTTIVSTVVSLVTLRIAKLLHFDMIQKITNAPVNLYFDKTPSGRILNRFSSDLNKLDNAIHMKVAWTLNLFVMCSFDIYVAALNTPWALCIVPVFLLLLALLLRYYIKTYREINRLASVTHSPLMNHLGETISGATTIRSFHKEDKFIHTNYRYLNIVTNVGFWRESLKSWFAIRIEVLSIIILGFTCGFLLSYRDKADAVLIGVLFNRFIAFNMLLMWACALLADLEGDLVSYDRCIKMLEIPQEAQARIENPELVDWPRWGQIEFNDYSLRYRPETDLVLKNLTMSIQAGQKIGIVGRTGAGKSTICLGLCRIVEADSGSILIDGIDISTVGLEDLREKITIIPQDPTLFEGTLRFNLDPVGTISDYELLNMAQKASLEELVNRDETGLDQKIEDGGKNLSSGEKQLICICRAILRKNKIVLMDEATANIDIKTEQIIQKLIQEEFVESTVLTIAHRLNTIISSDKVLVLSAGEIVEFDDPQKLLENSNSMFYSYANELKQKEDGN